MNDPQHFLMRMTAPTDVDPADPDYWGAFSAGFRIPPGSQIVGVDWSVKGEVTLTYLIPGPSPFRPDYSKEGQS